MKNNIYDYLPVGEENAIPSIELAGLLGFKNVRKLQAYIESLRLSGHVICSLSKSPGGYYVHKDKAELKTFIKTIENRACSTLCSIQSAKQALRDMGDVQ